MWIKNYIHIWIQRDTNNKVTVKGSTTVTVVSVESDKTYEAVKLTTIDVISVQFSIKMGDKISYCTFNF